MILNKSRPRDREGVLSTTDKTRPFGPAAFGGIVLAISFVAQLLLKGVIDFMDMIIC